VPPLAPSCPRCTFRKEVSYQCALSRSPFSPYFAESNPSREVSYIALMYAQNTHISKCLDSSQTSAKKRKRGGKRQDLK
jgi:hypothetical protein